MAFVVSGVTRDKSTGSPLAACDVHLLKYNSGTDTFTQVASGVSDGSGVYSLTAADADPTHCVISFNEAVTPVVAGATVRSLEPTAHVLALALTGSAAVTGAQAVAFVADNQAAIAGAGAVEIIGEIPVASSGAGAFTPLSLFASGEAGAWYDPSDLSTLWKDTAGTDHVTLDGDLVARPDDKSGNANHLTQATLGSRPSYKTSGGLHWLEFDGIADHLFRTSSILMDGSGTEANTVVMGVFGAVQTRKRIFSHAFFANSGTFYDITTGDSGVANFINRPTGSSAQVIAASGTYFNSAPHVYTWTDSAKSVLHRLDGAAGAGSAYTGTTANSINRTCMGALMNDPVVNFYAGRIYGLVAIKRVLTAGEIADTEAWMAAKAGVTL